MLCLNCLHLILLLIFSFVFLFEKWVNLCFLFLNISNLRLYLISSPWEKWVWKENTRKNYLRILKLIYLKSCKISPPCFINSNSFQIGFIIHSGTIFYSVIFLLCRVFARTRTRNKTLTVIKVLFEKFILKHVLIFNYPQVKLLRREDFKKYSVTHLETKLPS
jgi:hypothetical protein